MSPENFFRNRKGAAILVKMNKPKSIDQRKPQSSGLKHPEKLQNKKNRNRVFSPEPIRVSQDLDIDVSKIIHIHASLKTESRYI